MNDQTSEASFESKTEDLHRDSAIEASEKDASSSNSLGDVSETKSIDECLKDNLSDFESSLYADEFIAEVDKHYQRVACTAILVWLALLCLSFLIGRQTNSLEVLEGGEKQAPMAGGLVMAISLFSAVLPFLNSKQRQCLSGVLVCAVTAQSIALVTNLLLAFAPTPVLIDHVTGMKTYLVRYCEWAPLAFVMAFLTDSCRIDNPANQASKENRRGTLSTLSSTMSLMRTESKSHVDTAHNPATEKNLKILVESKLKSAYNLGLAQGISAFCGWVFPFCPNFVSWVICLFISCALFSLLWKRLYVRTKAFQSMKPGSTASEKEIFHWSKLSLGLLRTCAISWSLLVINFFFFAIGPHIFSNSSFFNLPSMQMILECSIDVLLKVFYLTTVVDVHNAVFDNTAKTERRLEELKQMLSAVWDNSSDMIILSVRGISGDVSSMLSPTYLKIFSDEKSEKNPTTGKALAFELNARSFTADDDPIPIAIYDVNLNHVLPKGKTWTKNKSVAKSEMVSLSKLVIRAWESETKNKEELFIMHDLSRSLGQNIRCEANITRMEENALVIVVRDISERCRRFEAEKKAISETTARLRDAAANRFTRHEVKNGLLAAVALCDSLNESVQDMFKRIGTLEQQLAAKDDRGSNNGTGVNLDDSSSRRLSLGSKNETSATISATGRYIYELDRTLHDILDTILAEAMARDVIWEGYEPKLERVKVAEVLSTANTGMSSMKRFPLKTIPESLPDFCLDPQLLKYIHRNAISNACKYGKKSGIVTTNVFWNKNEGEFRMEVVNLPGERHSEILQLGTLASEVVFSPRKRLAVHCEGDDDNPHSSGDGAWIMHKCAKTLGGNCEILFETEHTTFSFSCPAKVYDEEFSTAALEYTNFELPKNIYAIAIDDSKIQRKLLTRFFEYAGVPEDRILILGSSAEEITTFCDYATAFVDEHPGDFILMIVDENLDLQEKELVGAKGMTVSGSSSVADMRRRLLPDQERRVLALIRSANDSSSDVSIYKSRAHGYLPKAPIKKDKVLEALAPLWLERFPNFEKQTSHTSSRNKISSYDDVIITLDDLMPLIEGIDELSLLEKLEWSLIWEKLHALKGDLQIMPNRQKNLETAIVLISNLKGPRPPNNFRDVWKCIRGNVLGSN